MRFMPLRHRSFQLMLLILSLYTVHAHYSELDATYAFNIAGIPRMSSVTIFQSDLFVLSTNFLFKFNVTY